MKPTIIQGSSHKDQRGSLSYNNSFDATSIKRIYVIENNLGFIRRWQGHKIEQRWFSAIKGDFVIQLIKVDNWDKPNRQLEKITFELSEGNLDILHIPAGYITSIKSLKEGSKLVVLSNYALNEINDEYRFSTNYFKEIIK